MHGILQALPPLRANLALRVAAVGRHWAPAVFVLGGVVTLACLLWLALGPAPGASPAGYSVSHFASGGGQVSADSTSQPGTAALPLAASNGPGHRGGPGAPDSEWQRQRAQALAIERMNAEMMPLTPGVTPEQYVGGDDLGPDAAAASEGDADDSDGEEFAED